MPGRRSRITQLAAGGGALLLLGLGLRLGLLDGLAPAARLFVAWGWLALAPGYFLLRAARLDRGFMTAEVIGLSAALGLGLAAALAWVTALAGLPLSWAAAGAAGAGLVAAAIGLVPRGRAAEAPAPAGGAAWSAGPLLLAAVAGALLLALGGTIDYPEDSLGHIAVIREAARADRAMPPAVWYPAGEVPGPDPRCGMWHATAALLVRSARVSAADGWLLLPGLLAPFAVLVAAAFARALLPSRAAALLAVPLFLLAFHAWDPRGLRTLSDSTEVALLLHAAAMALFLRGLREGRTRQQVAGALLCGGAALAHVYGAVQALAGFCSLAAGAALVGRWRSWGTPAARAAAIALAACAPWLVYWRVVTFHPANPSNYIPQGVLRLGERAFVWSPQDALATLGLAGLAAFLALPWLWREGRADPGLLCAAACSSASLLALANPLLLPVLYQGMSYLAIRLKYLTPAWAVLAWAISRLAARARRGPARAPALAALVALLLLHVPTLQVRAAYLGPSVWSADSGPLAIAPELSALDRLVERDAVIASDAWTAYALCAFSDRRVLAIPAEHASPNDARPVARLRAAAEILSPGVELAETLAVIRDWGVTHVLVNLRHDRRFEGFENSIHPERTGEILAKFTGRPDLFAPVASGSALALFRVERGKAGEELARAGALRRAAAEPPGRYRDAEPLALLAPGISLLEFAVEPPNARPGETVRVECVWRRDAPPAGDGAEPSWWLYLRGDRLSAGDGASDRPWSKLARLVRERREGERSRFRARHTPGTWDHPTYRWLEGEIVRDAWPVKLPPALASGEYRLELALLPARVAWTLSLDDYLRDRDAFSGRPVGRLRVGG